MQGRTLTAIEKAKFIQKLVSTGGNISRAAKAIKINRNTLYDHKKNDPVFSELWDEAIESGVDDLEQEARRRAFKGTRKPVYQKGQLVGNIQEYSDTLLIFLLKGKRPDVYRERVDVNQKVTGSIDVTLQDKIKKFYGDGNGKSDGDGSGA